MEAELLKLSGSKSSSLTQVRLGDGTAVGADETAGGSALVDVLGAAVRSDAHAATSTVKDAYLRWVIYTPYATPESTGLSTKPAENAPWLMDQGTAGAHVMITPPRAKKP